MKDVSIGSMPTLSRWFEEGVKPDDNAISGHMAVLKDDAMALLPGLAMLREGDAERERLIGVVTHLGELFDDLSRIRDEYRAAV